MIIFKIDLLQYSWQEGGIWSKIYALLRKLFIFKGLHKKDPLPKEGVAPKQQYMIID